VLTAACRQDLSCFLGIDVDPAREEASYCNLVRARDLLNTDTHTFFLAGQSSLIRSRVDKAQIQELTLKTNSGIYLNKPLKYDSRFGVFEYIHGQSPHNVSRLGAFRGMYE
jgi:hypothetical protein